MEIIQYSNGPEGATNSSKQQNVGIQMPANNSYQQSLYIAAISKYLGYEGLVGPVAETQNGITYTFDFHQPETGRFFKIFQAFDAEAYRLYSEHPGNPYLIFDLPTTVCRRWDCQCDRCELVIVDEEVDRHICDNTSVRIYQAGKMWECIMKWNGGLIWRNVLPPDLAELMGDNEWMNDWLDDEDDEATDDSDNDN